jgi:quercetin dioxygenase-like cupin family protein
MRRIVTGIDDEGRSTVLADGAVPTAFHAGPTSMLARTDGPWGGGRVAPGEAVVHQLWASEPHPVLGRHDPTLTMEMPDFETPPGATSWILTELGPGAGAPMHLTQTIDYGLVVRGEVEMGLETGPVTLCAGDAVFMDGVMHSWKAGPEGCTIATVQVGLAAHVRRDPT